MPLRFRTPRAGLAVTLLLPAALALTPGTAHADDDLSGTVTIDRAFIDHSGTNLFLEGTYSCDSAVKQPQISFAIQDRRTRVLQLGQAFQKKRFVLRCDGETHDWVGSTPNVPPTLRYRARDRIWAAANLDDEGQMPREHLGSATNDKLVVARL